MELTLGGRSALTPQHSLLKTPTHVKLVELGVQSLHASPRGVQQALRESLFQGRDTQALPERQRPVSVQAGKRLRPGSGDCGKLWFIGRRRRPDAAESAQAREPPEREGLREEITRAYRKLAKTYHPDRAGAAGEGRMKEVNLAYEEIAKRRKV